MDIRFFPDRTAADLWRRFRYAEVCTSKYDRGTYAVGSGFACIAASYQPAGPRFMSVGRFGWEAVKDFREGQKKGQRTMHPDTICYLPGAILEIEDGDLLDRLEYTRSLIEEMRGIGLNTDAMHLRFSGNESLWVCIPASAMGHPVGSIEDQKALRQRVFNPLTRQKLDQGLFDARQLHRLLGSTHEKGSRTRILPISALEGRSALDSALKREARVLPPVCPERPCKALVKRCEEKTRFHVPPHSEVQLTEGGGGAFMAETENGVGEGERNDVAFRRACVLWRRYSRRDAWAHLQEWNQKCQPPLRERELASCFESARRMAGKEALV